MGGTKQGGVATKLGRFFPKKNALRCNINAFSEVLFSECYEKVYRIIFSITFNKERTEDIVQEAFYKALSHIESLKKDEKFCSWVITIALNEMKDQAKRYNRQKKELEKAALSEIAVSAGAKSEFANVDAETDMRALLNLLEEKDREILVLSYILDFPIDRIAGHFDITANNARVRLNRAKAKLKELYSQTEKSESRGAK